ncbi:MAG: class I SAM-dependent methyltransferase [Acidimicrobiia bacterium]|nr:class I SAM-dependent methyltransferase [Acidimicrobiia bacterium]MYG57123.1 class I SAM-dependent methyltransferase [Acidimicrobiia bacterium]MYJ31461.1 class I SAM-dependent methyltransferase [Acidimicrobiia bacterium]
MEPSRRAFAEAARGFMPPDEGVALHQAACDLEVDGPLLEVGSYCGKSSVYLGDAAQAQGRLLFALDHHRGSEENQPGWEWHEPDLVDPEVGLIDTLPHFRRTIHQAGLERSVVALVGDSVAIAQNWSTPLAFLFIDGGHGTEPAHADYESWVPHVAIGGRLVIHDVFPDPADGGRPPYEIYCRAMESGAFAESPATGSLRVLTRHASGI